MMDPNIIQQISYWIHDEQCCVTVERIVRTFSIPWKAACTLLQEKIPKEKETYRIYRLDSSSSCSSSLSPSSSLNNNTTTGTMTTTTTTNKFHLSTSIWSTDTSNSNDNENNHKNHDEESCCWYAMALESCSESIHTANQRDLIEFQEDLKQMFLNHVSNNNASVLNDKLQNYRTIQPNEEIQQTIVETCTGRGGSLPLVSNPNQSCTTNISISSCSSSSSNNFTSRNVQRKKITTAAQFFQQSSNNSKKQSGSNNNNNNNNNSNNSSSNDNDSALKNNPSSASNSSAHKNSNTKNKNTNIQKKNTRSNFFGAQPQQDVVKKDDTATASSSTTTTNNNNDNNTNNNNDSEQTSTEATTKPKTTTKTIMQKSFQEEKENIGENNKNISSSLSLKVGNADDFCGDIDDSEDDSDEDIKPLQNKKQNHKGRGGTMNKNKKHKRKQIQPVQYDHEEEEEEEQDTTSKDNDKPLGEGDDNNNDLVKNDATASVSTIKSNIATKNTTKHRRRRKRLVDKTFQDENGFLVTETQTIWEDVPSDEEDDPTASQQSRGNMDTMKESPKKKLKPSKKPSSAVPKTTNQKTLIGFLKKK